MGNHSSLREEKNKQKYKKKTIISLLLAVLLFGGIGYGAYVYMKTSSLVQKSNLNLARGEKSNLREKSVKPIANHVSLLIMGIDENQERQKEYNGAFHTDALLLATFNKDDKTVKLTSIPRDTYTYVPVEKKKDKITHAYGSGFVKNGKDGGPQASVEAVEKLLQVPVDYFVKFNFGSFTKIVDGLDGIEVDVPVEFTEQNSKDEPDAMRGQRQQLVIESILSKLKSVGSITKLEKIVEAVDDDFKTNLVMDDILSFYKYGLNGSVEKIQLAGDDLYLPNGPNGQRVYYYNPNKKDLQSLSNTLRTHLGLSEKQIEEN
ncbi:LCP family protein [Bacillus thuringiensis]|nr:LCP family protein [Bacillus thuringiensis]